VAALATIVRGDADSVTRVTPEPIKREGLMVCVNLIVTVKDVSMPS